ncbi:MAG: squalene/phytoene synthase family protein [Chromatiales bacterium]|nr:squalene/phytoene synthase family protein [Chromatiales bacterium]
MREAALPHSRPENAAVSTEDLAFQQAILPRVSRTFALTIPQLPLGLHGSVANAYLLCRLADTIEDDPALDGRETSLFMEEFLALVSGDVGDADEFARRLGARLSGASSPAERELVAGTAPVLRITHRLPAAHREAVVRCVTTMGRGMPAFQQRKTIEGLTTLEDLDQYCYFVAGVVGEMLTDLFCEHCPELRPHHEEMMALAVCFGQGLQMTNILKDIWEDRGSDTCWLPRSVFGNLDQGLGHALNQRDGAAMRDGINRLVAIAHGHLHAALRYTQRIPPRETGIRRFCLWAIGMALLTLRKIHANPGYTSGQEVKISRSAVRATILVSNLVLRSDRAMEAAFRFAARGLPSAPGEVQCPPPGARLVSDRLS